MTPKIKIFRLRNTVEQLLAFVKELLQKIDHSSAEHMKGQELVRQVEDLLSDRSGLS